MVELPTASDLERQLRSGTFSKKPKYAAKHVWICRARGDERSAKPTTRARVCVMCGEPGAYLHFASRKEAKWYRQLRVLEKAGGIRDLRMQGKFPISVDGEHICDYLADFDFFEGNRYRVIDVKGMDTDVSKLKRKLVKAVHKVEVEVV